MRDLFGVLRARFENGQFGGVPAADSQATASEAGPSLRAITGYFAVAGLVASALVLPPLNSPARSQEVAPSISPLTGEKPRLFDAVAAGYIIDRLAAQQLGKALFWDTAAGSDGVACASCHYSGGADIRLKNQVGPGHDDVFGTRRNSSNGKMGPNAQLSTDDFPFRQLSNMNDRKSSPLWDTNDRLGSQGSFGGELLSIKAGVRYQAGIENCSSTYDSKNPFHANGLIYRSVTGRNSPSNVNAVFYDRQFWDGRANNAFNGVDPFGKRTNTRLDSAGVLYKKGSLELKKIALPDSSLASQAVGPPLSSFEMSCQNKTFADLGRKLLALPPLQQQKVATNDSLFSQTRGLVNTTRNGLTGTYADLVRKAFPREYWEDLAYIKIENTGLLTPATSATGYRQIEHNFTFFFGLALQEYQAMLVSDRSPFDSGNLTAQQLAGKNLFLGKAKCVSCHSGPLLSNAAATQQSGVTPVERMIVGDGNVALYDGGFYNIGVTPTSEDRGLGNTDPYGFDLSYSRQWVKRDLLKQPSQAPDSFEVDPCEFEVKFTPSCNNLPNTDQRTAVDGAFKTPTLRNVGVNAPYMHDGGLKTLKEVMQFYNRGGNVVSTGSGTDSSGFGGQASNLDADIVPLGLTDTEMNNLVAFMLTLTDQRVTCHQAPFDHPALPITLGHDNIAASSGSVRAKDIVAVLPAVGATGLPGIKRPCFANSGDLFASQSAFRSILGLK